MLVLIVLLDGDGISSELLLGDEGQQTVIPPMHNMLVLADTDLVVMCAYCTPFSTGVRHFQVREQD